MKKRTESWETDIPWEDILVLVDSQFHPGNVCLVTEAGEDVGRATAVTAAANNLQVVGLGDDPRRGEQTEKLIQRIGGKMSFIKTDLGDEKSIAAALNRATEMGSVKFLAITSTGAAPAPHFQSLQEDFDRTHQRMLRTPFLISSLAIPYMEEGDDQGGVIGSLVSQQNDVLPSNIMAQYMSYCALRGLTRSLSAQGRGKIRSFAVSTCRRGNADPGLFCLSNTQSTQNDAEQKGITDATVTPFEIASIFLFGFSRFARQLVNGSTRFEGGLLLRP
jgi:3-hydroxybutyrate dehydrogenase